MHSVSKLTAREPYAKYFEGWSDPREYVDERTTADRLRVAGFEDVEVNLRESTVVMKTREEYIEYLRT